MGRDDRDRGGDSDCPPVPPSFDSYNARTRERATDAKTTAQRALDVAAATAAGMVDMRDDVAEIKAMLGRAPAPGHPGMGLIGAVAEMQEQLERFMQAEDQHARSNAGLGKRTQKGVIAVLVAALGGGGAAGLMHAFKDAPPTPAQTTGGKP
jgi:hypothetical protein